MLFAQDSLASTGTVSDAASSTATWPSCVARATLPIRADGGLSINEDVLDDALDSEDFLGDGIHELVIGIGSSRVGTKSSPLVGGGRVALQGDLMADTPQPDIRIMHWADAQDAQDEAV